MLRTYNNKEILSYTHTREGETKIGQTILSLDHLQISECNNYSIKYAILGIDEDLGIVANKGIKSSQTAWNAFLKSFLNTQSNEFLDGKKMLLVGVIKQLDSVATYDEVVSDIVVAILKKGWIPIVIGGGHNNAYPLLKALSTVANKAIHCINIDPHADIRMLEERHSGNGFSYAIAHNYLKKYSIVGLHQSYNNQFILDTLQDNNTYKPFWWEDIFLKNKYTWTQAIQEGLDFVKADFFGVELDIDAIENTLSSAMTPVGISAQQACQSLYILGKQDNASYLHLPEAMLERADGLQQQSIGKLLSYLTTAFIKGKEDTI
jgi:formiminoglutamase